MTDGIVATSPDPTANVRELVEAANLRTDDLRKAEARRVDEAIAALRREAELRADFAAQLTLAETKRIDAIRAVDVAAVAIANERASATAGVLANQVATSAETLRALVATQAAATATQFTTTTTQLSERIAQLERSNYEGQGRSTLADPAMRKMVDAMELMQSTLAATSGRGAGVNQVWLALVGGGGLLIGIGGLLTALIK